jgi:hypothetical protein
MMTNFDTDTRFQKGYLEELEEKILQKKIEGESMKNKVFQPILFYNWELTKRSSFVRNTSLIRNMLMMGSLIPFNLNVMSVYSFSLALCIDGNYTHPAYQMEDIIC